MHDHVQDAADLSRAEQIRASAYLSLPKLVPGGLSQVAVENE
jgi:hypothetical protein